MSAEKLRQRMHDDIGAVVYGLAEIRTGQRIVDDERNARVFRNSADRLEIGDHPSRIGNRFHEDRLGLGTDGALEAFDVVGLGPHHVPAEILERVVELIDRATVELFGGNELVPRRIRQCITITCAACPEATATPAVPPSSAATRSSSTAL